ncbi:spore coat protein GerQ [Ureibacillus xyleni]|uniref:Spore coat protein GerQ n=1 Tax=Ureibacillus xyleni TaxID=614648 RepID=A0A285R6W2_9BACL|nr:spore coat protein GerQ [Ureibacillus xyleni]SOB89604.1 spore coat protein GerQ [Ureibacillus xyleni]
MYYYWGQQNQQQYPMGQYPMGQYPAGQMQSGQSQTRPFPTPQTAVPNGGQTTSGIPVQNGSAPTLREESYIENILRLNRGKPATFFFTVPSANVQQDTANGNTIRVRGVVVEAGRDHAIIRELDTNHNYLFPMIYFDFAEFDEELAYINYRNPFGT